MGAREIISKDAMLFILLNETRNEGAKIHLHTLCGKLTMALQLGEITLEEYDRDLKLLFKLYGDLEP